MDNEQVLKRKAANNQMHLTAFGAGKHAQRAKLRSVF
jgi:hypothetical protein